MVLIGVEAHRGFCSVGVSDPLVKSNWLWSMEPIPDVLDAVEYVESLDRVLMASSPINAKFLLKTAIGLEASLGGSGVEGILSSGASCPVLNDCRDGEKSQ